jgi:ABC-2 type transport system permease protein
MAVFFSNRTDTLFSLFSMFIHALSFGLLGTFVTMASEGRYKDYLQGCPDYTSFLVVGFVVNILVFSARGNVTNLVRSRAFPNLFMAPCRLPTVILGANMWRYVWIIMQVLFILMVSWLCFGVRFNLSGGFLAVVACGILLMTAFDMLGAAFKIITKSENDPLNWTLGLSAAVLAGGIFPIQVLPAWVQPLCKLHPQYYINTFARRTMGGGESLAAVGEELGLFCLTSLILLAVSFAIFRLGFNRARVEGTLGHQ